MARPNRPRIIGSERSLARRLQWERESRGWTYDGLAARLTAAGCPIQASAIYKIEKGDPPRRITVDELVALAQVFEADVQELLVPVEAILHRDIARVAEDEDRAYQAVSAAIEQALEARVAHLTMYKRAGAEGNTDLAAALDAWDAEQQRRIAESVKRMRPGGLVERLEKMRRELDLRSERETLRERGLSEAESNVFEAIDSYAEQLTEMAD